MGSGNSPAGWYPDPTDLQNERFWDGTNWTPAVRASSSAGLAASELPPATPPAPPVIYAQLPAPPTVKLPVPNHLEGPSGLFPKLRTVAVGVGLVLVVASAGFVVSGGLRSDSTAVPSPGTEQTTSTTSPARTTTTSVAPTTSPPISTTSMVPPVTTQSTTATSFVGRSGFLAIPRERVSATCQGANGIEGDLVTPVDYSPGNLVDGRPDSGWRCRREEVLAGRVTIDLGQPVRVTEIGIFAGYDKIDPHNGVDRYLQNHRVARARWEFSDGTSVVATYVDERRIQQLRVDVVTTSITLVVEDYHPSRGVQARDMIAISEIEVWGVR
jgi:hypothetical protein